MSGVADASAGPAVDAETRLGVEDGPGAAARDGADSTLPGAAERANAGAESTSGIASPASAQDDPPLIANTIVIRRGGTYYGNWVSTDPAVAAVSVYTDEPVVIENSTVTGLGQLIAINGTNGANVTVRNVTGTALDPQIAGKARGAFVVAYVTNSLLVQNCTMIGTSFGVKAAFSTPSSLRILDNIAINLEDRASDGNGGFQTARPQLGHFVYLYQMSLPGGAEIGWNQVVQTVNQSSVDDAIDVFKSQGTSTYPISIHDNYVEGASSPATASYVASSFSATGDSTSQEAAFVNFVSNQVVHTAGNGLSITNGHDITASGNRVVSCGKDSAGNWYSRAGLTAITLANKSGGPGFFDNVISTTAGGLIVPGAQSAPVASDSYASPADLVTASNNIDGNLFTDPCLVNGTLTLSAEDAERTYWTNKVTANNQAVGDQHGSVTVAVTPSTSSLTISQTQQMSAVVAWASNPAVTWRLDSAVGSISATGLYTAPASVTGPQTVAVTATSVQDPTKSATASLTVNPAAIVLTPASTSLAASQTQQYSAVVQSNANQSVTWFLSPSLGSISASGLYTAPASITSVQGVTVTAVSVADTNKYANASITLLPPVKVNLVSSYASLTVSQTTQLTAVVANSSNTAVTWTISPAVGTISSTGLYTAPASIPAQQTITFTATSVADPTKSAIGSIVLNPPVYVNVVPAAVMLSPSGTQQFTGNVAWTSNTAVTWTMSPAVGTLSSAGLYTAPAGTATPQTVTVTATSVADPTKSSSATVTLNPPVNVSITPSSATVTLGQTQLYTAVVQYSTNTAVNWSISPALGSIASNGRYTPPTTAVTTPQTVTVTATSAADPTRSASAMVTINPPVAVTLTPATSTLTASQTSQLTAGVAWNSNTSVTWSISPSVGSISASGLYTAPASITSVQTLTVTAISVADATKYATASITLLPPVKVNLPTSYAALTAFQTAQFTAQVMNTSSTAVTWTISPSVGSISSTGLYTAPASIPAQQTITFTATSVADPTKSAIGSILLSPPLAVTVVPGNVTLTTSHTQQLVANVAWNTNTAVTWTMAPALGTLTSAGLYTAPATINTNATVTVTATSVADPTKSGSATINLLTLVGPAPIVITEGGTYSGNWISNDPTVAAVTVNTDAPVVIQNSTIQGRGTLISIAGINGANVTVQNVTGTGLDPLVSGLQRGAFVAAFVTNSLVVKNCTMNGTSFGVKLFAPQLSSLSILNNVATNLEDRASDGNGGFLTTRPQLGHFIILHNTFAPNGAEIAWNQLKQTIGQSSTEDAINIFSSRGTSATPIWVHDNYLEGYSSSTIPTYTGNGLIADGDSSGLSGYVLFQANEMVHTAGGGVSIASGHDVSAINNRVVSCGKDASGNWYSRVDVSAIYVGNYYGASNFTNNTISSTSGGLVAPGANGLPSASDIGSSQITGTNSTAGNTFTDPCLVNGTLNLGAEDTERTFWTNKLSTNSILLGDQH